VRDVDIKTTTYSALVSDNRTTLEGNHASTPFTITLGDAATMAAAETGEYEVTIANIGAALITVARAGADTIDGAATSIVLPQYSSITLKVNAATDGYNSVARGLGGLTSTVAELNILDGVTSTTAELNILDGVTSTTAELNILDGVTSTTAELNILDGVTSTAAELNYNDGATAGTTITTGDSASATSEGIVELATQAEVDTGTDTLRVVTPETLAGHTGIRLDLQSEVATTSGTSVTLASSIPSWVQRLTVMFAGVSANGTSNFILQIGDSGGFETTGYNSAATQTLGAVTSRTDSTGFAITGVNSAGSAYYGSITLTLQEAATFVWASSGTIANTVATGTNHCGGAKALSAVLTQLQITTVGGTDEFDAGAISVMYE